MKLRDSINHENTNKLHRRRVKESNQGTNDPDLRPKLAKAMSKTICRAGTKDISKINLKKKEANISDISDQSTVQTSKVPYTMYLICIICSIVKPQ